MSAELFASFYIWRASGSSCVDGLKSPRLEVLMNAVPLWFERRFESVFPVTQLPNVCVRLRGTPARLEEMLRYCPREWLVKKPVDGDKEKWSIQEHAGHLLDLEALWTDRVEDFVAGRTELTVADLANRGTTEANYNARPLDQILSGFREARARLVDRAKRVDAALWERTIVHPRLKTPMRLVDHLFFVAEHDDHHLAWMWWIMGEENPHSSQNRA
jgi:uncharacterized damage-inducible protein DinB